MPESKPELCTIRIMFPVESDEQAIAYKRQINEVLKDNLEAQLHFALVPLPLGKPLVPQ